MSASRTLRLALDLRDPFAYLALEPSLGWAHARDLALDLLPFEGHVLKPPAPAREGDSRGVRHRRHRAEFLAREIATYAEVQGLTIRDPYRDASVGAASQAWLWLREQRAAGLPDFLRELFRAHWALELDASDPAAVARLVGAAGADAEACGDWSHREGRAALAAQQQALREEGVFQSPTYLLEGELFCGRQHLPLLGWILEGRRGPVPI